MAQVAQPPVPKSQIRLADLSASLEAIPATSATGGPLNLPERSEAVSRGAGCVNRARPDLWGAEVGNYPGLPDWADHGFKNKIEGEGQGRSGFRVLPVRRPCDTASGHCAGQRPVTCR